VRIAVGKGSAYDLFLTREIKNATLVRDASSGKSLVMFLRELSVISEIEAEEILKAGATRSARSILARTAPTKWLAWCESRAAWR